MDDAYRADLAALDDLVRRMARFEAHAEQVAGDVDAEVITLHAQWSGVAADEHLAAHRRWRDGAQDMRSALASLRHVVSTAHANYSAAVTSGRAMWM